MGQWIDVNDKAPQAGNSVLVWSRYHGSREVAQYTPWAGEHKAWTCDGTYYPMCQFTHWMPLPEPPEDAK